MGWPCRPLERAGLKATPELQQNKSYCMKIMELKSPGEEGSGPAWSEELTATAGSVTNVPDFSLGFIFGLAGPEKENVL